MASAACASAIIPTTTTAVTGEASTKRWGRAVPRSLSRQPSCHLKRRIVKREKKTTRATFTDVATDDDGRCLHEDDGDGGRRGGEMSAAAALCAAALTMTICPQAADAETVKELYVAAGNNAFLEKEFIDLKAGRGHPTIHLVMRAESPHPAVSPPDGSIRRSLRILRTS